MRSKINFRVICLMYLNERTVCSKFAKSLRALSVRCQELNGEKINQYLRMRLKSFSTVTVANERRNLLTLWRWAWESGHVTQPPRGVMRITQRPAPVQAWTMADLAKIVDCTKDCWGEELRCGVSKGLVLRTWLILGYETGARYGDLWNMNEGDIEGNVIRWQTSKTNVCQHRRLTPKCMRDVNAMLQKTPDGRILGWVCNKRHAMRLMQKYLASHGMSGSSKWLRRSSATHVEIVRPGKAKAFLGHKSPMMADKHYIDHSQIQSEDIVVPSY